MSSHTWTNTRNRALLSLIRLTLCQLHQLTNNLIGHCSIHSLRRNFLKKCPNPWVTPLQLKKMFVDANHAGNMVTRRSHTGILLFVQNSPIQWFSKRQNTVETSTFGSEFVALWTARDLITSMRYKLRMFCVPLDGPAQVYCDNQGVVKNMSIPESVLSKKHNAINYHAVREAAAAGVLEVHKEDTQTNLADLFTKVLPADRRRELLGSIVCNLGSPRFPATLWCRYLLREHDSWATFSRSMLGVLWMCGSRGLFKCTRTVPRVLA